MTDLRDVVRETWDQALDEGRVVAVGTVADKVIEDHTDLVQQEAAALIRRSIVRWIKDLARNEAEAAGALTLFGFPAVIAVPANGYASDDDDYVYMRSLKATWPDIEAGELLRVDNVRRAQARLDQYRGAKEEVRPLMEGTSKTLADALRERADG